MQTSTQRVKTWRANLRERGYVRPEIYVHRDDVPALKVEAEKLRKRRERKPKEPMA